MGTSTKRPKSKSGQLAGKVPAEKKGAGQQAAGAPQSPSKAPGVSDRNGATAKPASATVIKAAQPAPKTSPTLSAPSKREQKRETRREEISRKLEERRQQREHERRRRMMRRWATYGGIGLLVAGLIAFIVVKIALSPAPLPYQNGETIGGIPCDTAAHDNETHYHAHLEVYVNGQPVTVPGDIGRQSPGCLYWLHTHDTDGIIHIEAPKDQTYKLGQFFDIWGQPLSKTQLMNYKLDSKHQYTIYIFTPTADQEKNQDVNQPFKVSPPGDLKPYTGDPRQIQLKPHEVIYLEYGTPVVSPQPYSFPAGD